MDDLNTHMSQLAHDMHLVVYFSIKDTVLEELTLANLLGSIDIAISLGRNLPDRCKGAFSGCANDVVVGSTIPSFGQLIVQNYLRSIWRSCKRICRRC